QVSPQDRGDRPVLAVGKGAVESCTGVAAALWACQAGAVEMTRVYLRHEVNMAAGESSIPELRWIDRQTDRQTDRQSPYLHPSPCSPGPASVSVISGLRVYVVVFCFMVVAR
ncbi:hypothetical protein Vafri_14151, partial [Volvox africanus]